MDRAVDASHTVDSHRVPAQSFHFELFGAKALTASRHSLADDEGQASLAQLRLDFFLDTAFDGSKLRAWFDGSKLRAWFDGSKLRACSRVVSTNGFRASRHANCTAFES
jgi:hypothetical protein